MAQAHESTRGRFVGALCIGCKRFYATNKQIRGHAPRCKAVLAMGREEQRRFFDDIRNTLSPPDPAAQRQKRARIAAALYAAERQPRAKRAKRSVSQRTVPVDPKRHIKALALRQLDPLTLLECAKGGRQRFRVACMQAAPRET